MEQNNNNNLGQQFNEEESSFDIMYWVNLILHHWYLFVLCVLLAFAFSYLKNRTWMPSYLSVGTMMIDEYRAYGAGTQTFMQGFGLQSGHRNMENQVVMLSSYDLLLKVFKDLPEMSVDYINKGRFKTRNLYKISPINIQFDYLSSEVYNYLFKININEDNSFVITIDEAKEKDGFKISGRLGEPLQHNLFFLTINKVYNFDGNQELYFRFRSPESLIGDFSSRLNFSFIAERSSVLSISLVSQTPRRDIDFINKLCETFLAQNLSKKNDAAIKTIKFIDEQLLAVSESLSKSEDSMTKFRQSNQIIDVSSYTSSLLEKATEFDIRQTELNLQERYLNHLEEYITTNLEDGSVLAPSDIGMNDNQLSQLVQQLNDLQAKRSLLVEKNPIYSIYTQEIEKIKAGLFEIMKSLRASLELKKNDIKTRNQQLQRNIDVLPTKELEMIAIQRQYRVNDNYYTFFLQKRAEAEIQQASNTPDNEILDKARTTSITNSKEKSKTLTTYLLIGLLIPCLIIFLREFLNNTIRSIKDIEKNSPFSVIGSIRHTRISDPVLVAHNPRSSFTEMFRVIRTRIEFIAQRKTNIMISITSTESGDGKTYFCTNLAAVYAMTKRKVLLIDMDIRKPSVMSRFEKTVTYGLTDYLIDECTLEETIIRPDGVDYDILPGGTIPPNPGEIIRSEKLKELLENLRTMYDYIIIDTSPIGLVADAYSIVSLADVNLFVVRYEKTNKTFFKKLIQQLKVDKVERLYVVFNDVNAGESKYGKKRYDRGGYYGGYYGEYYGGGYGYTSKMKKKKIQERNQYYQDEGDF